MQNSSEPTAADVEALYPDWRTYDAPGKLYCARRACPGAALRVHGDSWRDVIDEIRAAEAKLKAELPSAWA
jgi:hypothetical protein